MPGEGRILAYPSLAVPAKRKALAADSFRTHTWDPMHCIKSQLHLLFCSLALSALIVPLHGCILVLPDDDDDSAPVVDDFADFIEVDAGCDVDGWWTLTASVSHPAGVDWVQAVWVEVELVYYDSADNRFFDDYLGSISLAAAGGSEWFIELSPLETFLDCNYPGEYLFRFFAEDLDSDLTSLDFIN